MKIEKMTIEDVNKIGKILQTEFDDFWNNNILRQEVMKESCRYIVAKSEENEILGFAGIFINVDIVEIMNIVVRKKYRKNGIGEKLLSELINLSKQTNLGLISLEVNYKNLPAINLYNKFGFKKVGIRKKYYNNEDNAIIMQKNI